MDNNIMTIDIDEFIKVDGSICHDCAEKHGAVWPKGHVATQWSGKCGVCLKESYCVATSDYSWPNRESCESGREF